MVLEKTLESPLDCKDVCFREGILFKLSSLLVNLIDSFTSICRGGEGHDPLSLLVLRACSQGPAG